MPGTLLVNRTDGAVDSYGIGQRWDFVTQALVGPLVYDEYREVLGQNGLGQRTGMLDGSGGTAWSLDSRGRLVREVKTVTGSGLFKIEYGYNSADKPAWMKYPADNAGNVGEQVTYGYNGQRMLNSLNSSTASYYYVPQTTYDAAGRVTKRLLGAANLGSAPVLTSSYYYQGWNVQGGRLRMVETKDSQNTLYQRLSYTYDPAGNITAILDGANSSQKQCFAYDNLYRLTSAKVGNNDANCSGTLGSGEYADETYAYDGTTGSLSTKSGQGTYAYAATQPASGCQGSSGNPIVHAVSGTSNPTPIKSLTYDCNGNMITRMVSGGASSSLTYDGENRLTKVISGTLTANFSYDGGGARVKSEIRGVTTVFIGGYYEWTSNGTTKYYGLRASVSAMRKESGGSVTLYWMLGDHLGSLTLILNASGNPPAPVQEVKYAPWGSDRLGSISLTLTRKGFTGQDSYRELGLYFYQARWVDVSLGRFVQADSIVPNGMWPLSFDRYAYVLDNPVNLVDPSGHTPPPNPVKGCKLYDADGFCVIGGNGYGGWPDYPNKPKVTRAILKTITAYSAENIKTLYQLYKNTAGWWNSFKKYTLSAVEFLTLMIFLEIYSIGPDADLALKYATSEKFNYWCADASGGDCSGMSDNAIFNYISTRGVAWERYNKYIKDGQTLGGWDDAVFGKDTKSSSQYLRAEKIVQTVASHAHGGGSLADWGNQVPGNPESELSMFKAGIENAHVDWSDPAGVIYASPDLKFFVLTANQLETWKK